MHELYRAKIGRLLNFFNDNTPMYMYYTAIIHGCKNDNFQCFLFFLKTQNVGTRSNEDPQSMFYSKKKKKNP